MPPGRNHWPRSTTTARTFLNYYTTLSVIWWSPSRMVMAKSLLREALLIADHNAYHVGEIIVVRRLLGVWGRCW